MPRETSFRDLKVWRDSMTLVEEIYMATRRFPREECFGLTSQLRRAAISIPSNIAEGGRRKRRKANLHHLDIALGSHGEVETQLEIAARLGFYDDETYRRLDRFRDRGGCGASASPDRDAEHSEITASTREKRSTGATEAVAGSRPSGPLRSCEEAQRQTADITESGLSLDFFTRPGR